MRGSPEQTPLISGAWGRKGRWAEPGRAANTFPRRWGGSVPEKGRCSGAQYHLLAEERQRSRGRARGSPGWESSAVPRVTAGLSLLERQHNLTRFGCKFRLQIPRIPARRRFPLGQSEMQIQTVMFSVCRRKERKSPDRAHFAEFVWKVYNDFFSSVFY